MMEGKKLPCTEDEDEEVPMTRAAVMDPIEREDPQYSISSNVPLLAGPPMMIQSPVIQSPVMSPVMSPRVISESVVIREGSPRDAETVVIQQAPVTSSVVFQQPAQYVTTQPVQYVTTQPQYVTEVIENAQ